MITDPRLTRALAHPVRLSLLETIRREDRREDPAARPPDSEPVQIVAFGHPLPPTPAGN